MKQVREAAGFATATGAAKRFRWRIPIHPDHESSRRGFHGQTVAKYAKASWVSQDCLLNDEGPGAGSEENETVNELVERLRQLHLNEQNKEWQDLRVRIHGDASLWKLEEP